MSRPLSFFSWPDAYIASMAPMEKNSVSPEESSTPSFGDHEEVAPLVAHDATLWRVERPR